MSVLSLRLPDSLHEKARELAEREDISLNQFIALAVAEKMSALLTSEYLEERRAAETQIPADPRFAGFAQRHRLLPSTRSIICSMPPATTRNSSHIFFIRARPIGVS